MAKTKSVPETKRAKPAKSLVTVARRLKKAIAHYPGTAPCQAGKKEIEVILDPYDYAWDPHKNYLERFGPSGPGRIEAVFMGMNPGPWGMAQTGVPFGSPDKVREFLKLEGKVSQPPTVHPKRPIHGLDCPRNEVSGQRVWGGIEECFGTPEAFFERFFITNYCPLVYQSPTGANIPPDVLPKKYLQPLLDACDQHLAEVLAFLRPQTAIGIGKFAEGCLARVIAAYDLDIPVGGILHPSPASPIANRGWLPQARAQLKAIGHPW